MAYPEIEVAPYYQVLEIDERSIARKPQLSVVQNTEARFPLHLSYQRSEKSMMTAAGSSLCLSNAEADYKLVRVMRF